MQGTTLGILAIKKHVMQKPCSELGALVIKSIRCGTHETTIGALVIKMNMMQNARKNKRCFGY